MNPMSDTVPPDDPWGNAYDSPMYWVPPMDDEYWEARNDAGEGYEFWTPDDEEKYWNNRLGASNAND